MTPDTCKHHEAVKQRIDDNENDVQNLYCKVNKKLSSAIAVTFFVVMMSIMGTLITLQVRATSSMETTVREASSVMASGLHKIEIKVERLAIEQRQTNKILDEHSQRLQNLEQK